MFLQQIDKPWTPGRWGTDEQRDKNGYAPFEVPDSLDLVTLEESKLLPHQTCKVLERLHFFQSNGSLPHMRRSKKSDFAVRNSDVCVYQFQDAVMVPNVGVRGIEYLDLFLRKDHKIVESWILRWGKDFTYTRVDEGSDKANIIFVDDLMVDLGEVIGFKNESLSKELEKLSPEQLFKQAVLRYNDWRDEYNLPEFGKF